MAKKIITVNIADVSYPNVQYPFTRSVSWAKPQIPQGAKIITCRFKCDIKVYNVKVGWTGFVAEVTINGKKYSLSKNNEIKKVSTAVANDNSITSMDIQMAAPYFASKCDLAFSNIKYEVEYEESQKQNDNIRIGDLHIIEIYIGSTKITNVNIGTIPIFT